MNRWDRLVNLLRIIMLPFSSYYALNIILVIIWDLKKVETDCHGDLHEFCTRRFAADARRSTGIFYFVSCFWLCFLLIVISLSFFFVQFFF